MKKGLRIKRSWIEEMSILNASERNQVWAAIARYYLYGFDSQLDGEANKVWNSIRKGIKPSNKD